jgi:hypothetical protein
MKLAEILSDLVSLRVCVRPLTSPPPRPYPVQYTNTTPKDPAAALALVSARSNPSPSSTTTGTASTDPTAQARETSAEDRDPDLQRAKDLVELHYGVKEAHKRGELGRGLMEARRAVDGAVGH